MTSFFGVRVSSAYRDRFGNPVGAPLPVWSRDELVLGVDKPGPQTTGPLPGTTFTTTTSGALVAGATYENMIFDAQVVPPTGTGLITIRNSILRGPPAGFQTFGAFNGIVRAIPNGHCPLLLEDCEIYAQTPSPWVIGVHGWGVTLRRCNVHHVVDSLSTFNNNSGQQNAPIGISVLQSWLHDHAYYPNPPDTTHTDGSHADGIQMQGGSGYDVRGNNFEGFLAPEFAPNMLGSNHTNAVFMIKPDVGLISGIVIEDNWLSGGAVIVNLAHDDPRFLTDVGRVWRNKIVRGSTRIGKYLYNPFGITCDFGNGTANRNVFTDNGGEVPVS